MALQKVETPFLLGKEILGLPQGIEMSVQKEEASFKVTLYSNHLWLLQDFGLITSNATAGIF